MTRSGNAPGWFRIAGAIALLWNLFGVAMYLSAVGLFGDPGASLGAAERAAAESIPGGIMAAFAIGTWSGAIGSLGLLLRRRWAHPLLILSLLALLLLEGWIVFASGHLEQFGLAVPIAVSSGAILLAGLATHARRRNWLR